MAGDYFSFFALPAKFALDGDDLKRRHLALQQELHPDRHVLSTPAQRQLAEQLTATCNEGYRVLSDSLARAAYLLQLREHDPFAEGDRNTMPVEFLERQLQLRECLEEIAASANTDAAQALNEQLQQEIDAEFTALAVILDDAGELTSAMAAARRLKYLINCRVEAQRLVDN